MKIPTPASASPIGLRLKLEMKKRGMTSAELAKRADVKTSFIYDVISGKSANPSTLKLARVASALGVDLAWLAGNSAQAEAISEEYAAIPRLAVEASATGDLVTTTQASESYSFRKNWIRDHLHADPADLRLMTVRGDSMEPTLNHNDTVLVDITKKNPSPPGIFMLFDGLALVAKRLEYLEQSRRLRIISDNPHYSIYERGVSEAEIIGRVVWFSREI